MPRILRLHSCEEKLNKNFLEHDQQQNKENWWKIKEKNEPDSICL